jgi:hypothetical protein
VEADWPLADEPWLWFSAADTERLPRSARPEFPVAIRRSPDGRAASDNRSVSIALEQVLDGTVAGRAELSNVHSLAQPMENNMDPILIYGAVTAANQTRQRPVTDRPGPSPAGELAGAGAVVERRSAWIHSGDVTQRGDTPRHKEGELQ